MLEMKSEWIEALLGDPASLDATRRCLDGVCLLEMKFEWICCVMEDVLRTPRDDPYAFLALVGDPASLDAIEDGFDGFCLLEIESEWI